MLVISTCNRTEIYYNAPKSYQIEILDFLCDFKKMNKETANYFQELEGNNAVNHLFRVALGLESQVVGDLQIINQVKQSYQLSADEQTAGHFLHRLLHTIFFTNKRIVQETPFHSGTASVSYASVHLIEELALETPNPKVLILGVGEIGTDVCRNLKNNTEVGEVIICNRTFKKAQKLAEECNFSTIPFEQAHQAIKEADIIVSSLQMETPFVTKENSLFSQLWSYKYFIDLSMPRSISPNMEDISGVLVYNIDQINVKVNEAQQKRLACIPQVENIMDEALAEFNIWVKEMEISPTIQKLKQALEQIRQEEMAKFAKKLNEEETQKIDQITKSMMQKIIKLPTLQLKAACKRGEAETLVDVLNDLFNLNLVNS
jgi:glutamyl-tRNA reductase